MVERIDILRAELPRASCAEIAVVLPSHLGLESSARPLFQMESAQRPQVNNEGMRAKLNPLAQSHHALSTEIVRSSA